MELKKELTVVSNLGEIKTETAKSTEKKLVTNLLEPLTLEVEAIEGTWVSISVDGKAVSRNVTAERQREACGNACPARVCIR